MNNAVEEINKLDFKLTQDIFMGMIWDVLDHFGENWVSITPECAFYNIYVFFRCFMYMLHKLSYV